MKWVGEATLVFVALVSARACITGDAWSRGGTVKYSRAKARTIGGVLFILSVIMAVAYAISD